MDGQTTDDGQRVITIVHLSLRLMCTKNDHQTGNIDKRIFKKITTGMEKDWLQQVEHMQALGVWMSDRTVSLCHTRSKCSMKDTYKFEISVIRS